MTNAISPAPPLPASQLIAEVPRDKLRALDKSKILRGTEMKIYPFTNRKQIGINTITFLPIAGLSSSLANDQPLLIPGNTHWAAGWTIKAQDPEFPYADDAKQSTQIDFLAVIG